MNEKLEPKQIHAKLFLMGITLADIAKMEGSSRQLVRDAIYNPGQRPNSKKAAIRRRVFALIGRK